MAEPFDLERAAASVDAILGICKRRGRILALMQDSPDPDSLACAAALRDLVWERLHKRVLIGYGGICGRAENLAMMRILHIDAKRVRQADIARAKTVCLLDTQPNAGNNLLLASRVPEIVVDHHIVPKRFKWTAEFSDVRPDYGATTTIFYEYFLATDAKINTKLATAMFYGIRSDTQELGRQAGAADIAGFQQLIVLADKRKLAKIRRAPVPPEYFRMLHEGLGGSLVAGSAVITLIRSSDTPEMMAEVADLLLRLVGVRSSVCYGVCGDTIYLSARTVDARCNAAQRMKRVVRRIGTGGGHRTMAGGQVPVNGAPDKRIALVHNRILKVFAAGKEPKPLLPSEEAPD